MTKNELNKSTRTGLLAVLTLTLGVPFLSGCSGGDKPAVVSAGAAPAPANLSPEEKRQYDEAVKASRPPTGQ